MIISSHIVIATVITFNLMKTPHVASAETSGHKDQTENLFLKAYC